MTDKFKDNNEVKEEVNIKDVANQHFSMRNQQALGGIDYLIKEVKSLTELIEKRVGLIHVIYKEEDWDLERFENLTEAEIKKIKASLGSFDQKHLKKFSVYADKIITTLEKTFKLLCK